MQISFKKSSNIYNLSRTNFIRGETIVESFREVFKDECVRNGKRKKKKKRTRGRTVAANTDLCHCARFISVRHSTSHIFEPHRIFQNPNKPITNDTTRSPVLRFHISQQSFDILFTRCVNKNTSHKKKRKRKRPRYHSERTGKLINARDNPSTSNDLRHCTLYLAQLQLSSAHERCVTLPSERRPPCIDCCIRLHQTLTPSTRTATIIPSRIRPTTNETNHQHSSPRPLPILLASIYSDSRRTNPLSSPRYRHQMRQT